MRNPVEPLLEFLVKRPISSIGIVASLGIFVTGLNIGWQTAEGRNYAVYRFLENIADGKLIAAFGFVTLTLALINIMGYILKLPKLVKWCSVPLGLVWILTTGVYAYAGFWGFVFTVGFSNAFFILFTGYVYYNHLEHRPPVKPEGMDYELWNHYVNRD